MKVAKVHKEFKYHLQECGLLTTNYCENNELHYHFGECQDCCLWIKNENKILFERYQEINRFEELDLVGIEENFLYKVNEKIWILFNKKIENVPGWSKDSKYSVSNARKNITVRKDDRIKGSAFLGIPLIF